MIRAHRVAATAQDDATLISGWNIAPNVAYAVALTPGATSCGVFLFAESDAPVASCAALVGAEQPCVLIPQSGQTLGMIDADLGWHLLLTTTGTESQRTVRINPSVDLADEIHPVYADDDLAVVRATAGIDGAAHYIDDLTVSCPLGLGAGLGDAASVPVDGAAVVGQVESVTWTGTPNVASEQAVIRRHTAIAPAPAVAPPAPPVVMDDTGETAADETTSGNVLTNDASGLTVTAVNGMSANVGSAVAGDNGGVFVITSDGAWAFDPDGDFAALVGSETDTTSVKYHASDGQAEASATLTVTVSSGSAAELWTPAEITGAIVFDALDVDSISLVGSRVAAWSDMFDVGVTATQDTDGERPEMGTGVVEFPGSSRVLTVTSSKSAAWCKALHSTGGVILGLVHFGTSSNPNALYGLCGTTASSSTVGFEITYDDRTLNGANNALRLSVRAGATKPVEFEPNNTTPGGEDVLFDLLIDADNATAAQRMSLSIDGGALITGNVNTVAPSTSGAGYDFEIGSVGNKVFRLTGSMRCLVVVPSVLSADDRAKVVGWMAHRHGRTSSLPSGHPYKSGPPTI